ncbi:nitrilase-related carbon-nitrogen hydrolase [Aquabacter cavernae]|uniref:nitrilase-related carbon-nitrogen hydrolase n=1 Tax=Aquabacter cavernae TaxID=2496029 RepID=UPI000F8F30E8|nr:nitrilase-related carbon-nitrogen hydrolase [Aquabacter cavernae]
MSDPDTLRIAVAQINAVMGDISGNAARIRDILTEAARQETDLVVLPELALCGAPPGALAANGAFLAACRAALEDLAGATTDGPACLLGAPWADEGGIANAAILLADGAISAVRRKAVLAPEEAGVFTAGPMPGPIPFRDTRLGIAIGTDLTTGDVCECLAETGADLLIALDCAAYGRGRADERLSTAVARVVETGLPLLYVNAVGGQDEAVFDGASFALNADHRLAMQFPAFLPRVRMSLWRRFETGWQCADAPAAELPSPAQADYAALMLGLRDFAEKNRFTGVVLELTDDAPTALLALLAVDALGADRVQGLSFPVEGGAQACGAAAGFAAALGMRHDVLPLAGAVDALERTLGPLFETTVPDTTEDQLRARMRGAFVVAAAEKFGALALTSMTRTDLLAGTPHCNADLRAGFAPLKDLLASEAPALAGLRNGWKPADAKGPGGEIIPAHLTRARDDLTDTDARLARFEDAGPGDKDGAPLDWLARRIMMAEGMRRRAAPGIRLTWAPKARRYPITNRFPEEG